MAKKTQVASSLVFSYLQLRQAIGALGLALPFVLAFGGWLLFRLGVQSSISHYYWTGMRDVLVGTLFAIGFFLFSYQGYEPADNIAGNLACVFAVGVALFPTTPDAAASTAARIIGTIHFAFATLFFGTLIFFSLVLFTKTDPKKKPTQRKLLRNRIYRGCGIVMAVCIVLTFVYSVVPSLGLLLAPYDPIYWLEAIAIVTFGISWIVKGEWILNDQ